ncbi:hypothetical protein FOL47_000311, partial [Perkinsus chesapeaki]
MGEIHTTGVPPTHYFLMKASADERRQAEERIDAPITEVTAHAMDIRDAYRAIKLGRNLQLLSQINYKNKNWTYTYRSDGHELCNNGDSLLLPTYKYNDAINFDLTTDVSYKKVLSLLNTLWQAWDLLPWHTLIVKNCLTALVSRLRAVKDHKWTDNIDHKTLDMLQRWQ